MFQQMQCLESDLWFMKCKMLLLILVHMCLCWYISGIICVFCTCEVSITSWDSHMWCLLFYNSSGTFVTLHEEIPFDLKCILWHKLRLSVLYLYLNECSGLNSLNCARCMISKLFLWKCFCSREPLKDLSSVSLLNNYAENIAIDNHFDIIIILHNLHRTIVLYTSILSMLPSTLRGGDYSIFCGFI